VLSIFYGFNTDTILLNNSRYFSRTGV